MADFDYTYIRGVRYNVKDSTARESIAELQALYQALTTTDVVPVTSLPATGEANKVFRLAGTGEYSDYMYAASDLTTPILMATYANSMATEANVRAIVSGYTPST